MGTYAVGDVPAGVVFDGANIWVANLGIGSVTRLLASTGAMVGTYAVGGLGGNQGPCAAAFDGANIWTANCNINSMTKKFSPKYNEHHTSERLRNIRRVAHSSLRSLWRRPRIRNASGSSKPLSVIVTTVFFGWWSTAPSNTSSTATVIDGNNISGKLDCSANTVAPLDNGTPNTAGGCSGQCAGEILTRRFGPRSRRTRRVCCAAP